MSVCQTLAMEANRSIQSTILVARELFGGTSLIDVHCDSIEPHYFKPGNYSYTNYDCFMLHIIRHCLNKK